MFKKESRSIQTTAGYSISTTLYVPTTVKARIVLAPAMGVDQRFYTDLSEWLASHNFLVLTFDYFGTGASLIGKLKDVQSDIFGWAENDCAAIIDTIEEKKNDTPLIWIGHSLGGQVVGLIPNSNRIDHLITVACGSGYWLENVPQLKRRVWLLWFLVAPLSTFLFGYFPGKKLNMVGDLPSGVLMQWRRWCLNSDYFIGVENKDVKASYDSLKFRMTSFSFSDDEMMSKKNIEDLNGFYTNAEKTMLRFSTEDLGVQRVGHFGFFKKRFKDTLWESKLLPLLPS